MRTEWPLAGREAELTLLLERLGAARSVLVSGPAGVGKTRLAREVAARAARAGSPVHWAVGSASARSVPFGAFTAVITALVPDADDGALVARMVDELRASDAVLGIDDAHLLDPASAGLVHHLVSRENVRVIVTVRDGEKVPPEIDALRSEGVLPQVALAALDREQTAAVLAAALGGPVDGISVDRLHDTTGGNALWLTMLVEGERAAGRLARSRDMWMWTGDVRLTPALDELLAAAVDRRDGPAREVLELLALGEPLAVSVVTALVDRTAVETLLDSGLARTETGTDRLRLAHPLFGEAVRARISTLRSRRLRGALYDALAGSSDSRDILRRAVLVLDSDRPHQPDLLLTAAVTALALVDYTTAIRLADAARAAGGGFEAQLMYAFLLAWGWTGSPDVAREFQAALDLAGTDDELIRAGVSIGFGLAFDSQQPDFQASRAAIAARLVDPERAVEVDGAAAWFAVLTNDLPLGQVLVEPVLCAPRAAPAAVAYAGWAAVAIAALQGWSDSSTQLAHRIYAACAQQPETAALWVNVVFWEVLGLALAGRMDSVSEAIRPFADVPPAVRFVTDATAAVGDLMAGRVVAAGRKLSDALLRAPGDFGGWTTLWAALACMAEAMAGDADAAAEHHRTHLQYSRDHTAAVDPLGELAGAWLAAVDGAVSEGIDRARAAAVSAAATQQWAIELLARLDAVRFGDVTQAGRLAVLATDRSGPLPAAAAAHARALADRDAGGLVAVAARYEDAGLLLLAADAVAQAATVDTGAAAARHAARAAALARRCEDARTPALVAALRPLPLSAREREIATLAHRGLTNREIGERLHLSTRTVEGHVYRACAKLGVAGRRELAERVGRW